MVPGPRYLLKGLLVLALLMPAAAVAAPALDLVETELGRPVAAAPSVEVAAAVGRVVAGLPPDQLHRAVDLVAAIAPLMPDDEAAEAVAESARRGVARVAAAHPDRVEDWWAELVADSIGTAVSGARPTTPDEAGDDLPDRRGIYARDLVIVPDRSRAVPPADAGALAFVPPKPAVRPHPPPVRRASRPPQRTASGDGLTFAEAFERDAKGLLRGLSDLLTRSIGGTR